MPKVTDEDRVNALTGMVQEAAKAKGRRAAVINETVDAATNAAPPPSPTKATGMSQAQFSGYDKVESPADKARKAKKDRKSVV